MPATPKKFKFTSDRHPTLAFKKAVSDGPPCSGILDFASRRWKLATWACPPEKTSN